MKVSRRKYHYIYKTTRFDGKYYIGMHSTDNLDDDYLGSGIHITRSIKHHGKDKHTKEILEYLPDRKALRDREEEIVNEELVNPLCINLRAGGGFVDSPTGSSNKGRKHSKEICERMSEGQKDKKHSEKTKLKISQSMQKEGNHFYGRQHSEETKQRIREKLRGNQNRRGRQHSEETKQRIREKLRGNQNRRIKCLNTEK